MVVFGDNGGPLPSAPPEDDAILASAEWATSSVDNDSSPAEKKPWKACRITALFFLNRSFLLVPPGGSISMGEEGCISSSNIPYSFSHEEGGGGGTVPRDDEVLDAFPLRDPPSAPLLGVVTPNADANFCDKA